MAKKKKSKEVWPDTASDGFHSECADTIAQYREAVRVLNEQRYEQEYRTAEEFVDELAPMMKEYLIKTYGEEKSHPHDLTAAAASFMEVYWIISDHRRL